VLLPALRPIRAFGRGEAPACKRPGIELNYLAAPPFLIKNGASHCMIDPHTKLAEVLDRAQEYLDLAIKARDRGEREFYERILKLYIRIAEEFEALIDR
jgi:hypothetical protein